MVVTGLVPAPRAQLWWKLARPITDPGQSQLLLKAKARELDGDPTVSNPSRVMRLAGSVAWPVKDGRIEELTDLLYPPGARASYGATELGAQLNAPTPVEAVSQMWNAAIAQATGPVRQPDAFGLAQDIIDGREKHMRDMVHAAIVNWRREHPDRPSGHDSLMRSMNEYEVYERTVAPQQEPAAGQSKREALEAEHRGPTEWWTKWQRLMGKWDSDVAEKASVPNPNATGPAIPAFTGQPIPAGTPIVLTDAQFMAGFKPPDYTVDWVIQKSYLYALTARTGHGKTAVAMLMMTSIVRGMPFHGKGTEFGGVLYFAGENSNDIRARYQLYADTLGFEIGKVPAFFIDGVLDINVNIQRIREEAAKIHNLSLIIIDTKQAYFTGDEGNSNEQQMAFARMARRLINELPTHPAVIILCHPVKNATQDNLTPMGGSAFLNEIDANLTLWAEDKVCTLSPHQDKWRGVSFEALAFDLRVATSEAMKDTKGRHIPSVIADPITEQVAERRGVVAEEDDKTVLRLVDLHKGAISIAGIAQAAGWFHPNNGGVAKSKAQRVIERLKGSKFIYRFHGSKYRLTKKGAKLIGVKFESGDDADE